ncbi:MAG: RDD family protein [Herminiimonas sp.]|nr:RDD family protein [Herminiimonas sp.]
MTAPSVKRRLACMLYESLLLFGVIFIADWLLDTLTQSRHALALRHTRQAWLFVVIGAYFVFFWCRGGQTLAMKTWHLKICASGEAKLPLRRAVLRYCLAWMWFLPAMAIDAALGLQGWPSIVVILVGMCAWIATTRFDPHRQFLHDRLAGTRIVNSTGLQPLP